MANLEKVIKLSKSQYTKLLNGESITKGGITYTYDANAMYLVEKDSGDKHVENAEWVQQTPVLTITFNETYIQDRAWVAIYDGTDYTNWECVYMSLTDHSTPVGTVSVPISSGKFTVEIEHPNDGFYNFVNNSNVAGGVSNLTISGNISIETYIHGDINDDGSFTCNVDYSWD